MSLFEVLVDTDKSGVAEQGSAVPVSWWVKCRVRKIIGHHSPSREDSRPHDHGSCNIPTPWQLDCFPLSCDTGHDLVGVSSARAVCSVCQEIQDLTNIN